MTIQVQLSKILKEKNISKYQLAKDTGIDESQINKYFNNKVNLSLKNIFKILEYLEYDIMLIPKTSQKD